MVTLILPEISIIFWLWEQLLGLRITGPSGIKTNLPGAIYSGRANRAQGVRALSLLVRVSQGGDTHMMQLVYSVRKAVKQKSHRDEMGFSE